MPYFATRKFSPVTRKRGNTAIITSFPYKNEVEEIMNKKKLAQDNKTRKREIKEQKKNKKTKLAKKKNKKKTDNNSNSSPECDSDENNIPCFYCHGNYLESNEGWVACFLCENGAHCSCAGLNDEAVFVCEFCDQK